MSDAVELPPEVQALLAATPRHPRAVFAGGMRMTGIQLPDGDQMVEPLMILWIDQRSGLIRAQRLINPAFRRTGGILEAVDCLLDACLNPGAGFDYDTRAVGEQKVFLPGKVVVTDEALARAVRDTLGPYGVKVERVAALPDLDQLFGALLSMGRLMFDVTPGEPDEPGEPFAWDLDPALAQQLFRAAATYWRQAPWDYMPDHPPLAVNLGPHGPEEGREVLYASVLGSAGEVFGVGLHYSLEDFRRVQVTGTELARHDAEIDEALRVLRQAGVPIDDVPEDQIRALVEAMVAGGALGGEGEGEGGLVMPGVANTLAAWLAPADETDPQYLDWIKQHGIKLFSRAAVPTFVSVNAQGQVGNPDARESRALAYALEALGRFFRRNHRLLDNPFYEPAWRLSGAFPVGPKDADGQRVMVTVTFPPEGYEWTPADLAGWFLARATEEEAEGEDAAAPPQEPTEAGRHTLYVFKATLDDDPSVWRRIEIRGDQSLDDLHAMLQRAFRWDDDHLYAFFLSGKRWDPRSEYDDPRAEEGRDAARYLLEYLSLKRGQKIAYVFDFGDEWWVTLRLERIAPGGVNARRKYPRLAEKEGRAPPQYRIWG